jgi:alpha-tubulin suppressor-like RCC1 family protein
MKRLLGLFVLSTAAACGEDVTSLDLASPPTSIVVMAGNAQSGVTGAALPNLLEVEVTDLNGRPVPAVAVNWTANRGTLQAVNDSTDNDGVARVRWVLPNESGMNTVTASVPNLGAVTFTAAAQPVSGTIVYRYLDAGSYHTCGITTTEELICWGYGADGQLNLGTTTPKEFPTLIPGDLRYRAVSGGRFHACALTLAHEPDCWGSNRDNRATAPGTILFQAIQAGLSHSCALSLSRELWCWGYNGEGEIGTSATIIPGSVASGRVGAGYRAVALGGLHTCALDLSGDASCWGFNAEGQLGNGGSATSGLPVAVSGALTFQVDPVLVPPSPDPDFPLPAGPFLAAGYEHTCGITTGGNAQCWGLNQDGQLGDGTRTLRRVPTAVSTALTFARITAGRQHSCAITAAGAAHCWGDNTFGQLGDGSTTDRLTPTLVSGGHTFAYLKAGDLSTCGVTTTGVAYCWGNNEYGQLGNGTTTAATVPTKVAFQP